MLGVYDGTFSLVSINPRANNDRMIHDCPLPQLLHTQLLAKCEELQQEIEEFHKHRQEMENKQKYVCTCTHKNLS